LISLTSVSPPALFALAPHLLNSDALASLSSGKTARTKAAKLSPVNSRRLTAVYGNQQKKIQYQSIVQFTPPTRPTRSSKYTFVQRKNAGERVRRQKQN
jgi:hypothetical protein